MAMIYMFRKILLILITCSIISVESFRVLVVRAGPAGKLSAIAFAKKAHDVSVFEQTPEYQRATHNSYNLVISKRGLNSLNRYDIPYHQYSVEIQNMFRHYHDGSCDSAKAPPSISIDRGDLLESMDVVAKQLGVPTSHSTFEGADFDTNIAYFSHGSEKFDVRIGADGANSKVRSSLRYSFPDEFSVSEDFDKQTFKTFTLTKYEMSRVQGYDES